MWPQPGQCSESPVPDESPPGAGEGSTGAGSGPHLDFQVWDPNWDKRRSYYDDGEAVTEGTGVPRVFF